MLVRWNSVPEADRNGLVLGYKVRAGSTDGAAEAVHRLPHPGTLSP